MKVYFYNRRGDRWVINDSAVNDKEVHETINKFLDEHNYKSYYTRMWYEDGMTWFDVGSHSEFFACDENLMEEVK